MLAMRMRSVSFVVRADWCSLCSAHIQRIPCCQALVCTYQQCLQLGDLTAVAYGQVHYAKPSLAREVRYAHKGCCNIHSLFRGTLHLAKPFARTCWRVRAKIRRPQRLLLLLVAWTQAWQILLFNLHITSPHHPVDLRVADAIRM